jgi:hypothetical protein
MSVASDARALRSPDRFTMLQHPMRNRARMPALPVLRALILASALSAVLLSIL